MNEPSPVQSADDRASRPVFISYATSNRKEALRLCASLEQRGIDCWISARDVAPGENYQEAIVSALRNARAVVLVFSKGANNSDEIKKELSLASRYRIPVIALRIQRVEPTDAFAYELSTRQWIDAFAGWDKSIDTLAKQIGQVPAGSHPASNASPGRLGSRFDRKSVIAAAVVILLLVIGAAWWSLRPAANAAHNMTVRLAGFQRLSPDLPATLPDTVNAEVTAAFNADGVVGVSTASARGSGPAYALGGTIQRIGEKIRVITRLVNERSGATLWTETFNYDGAEVPKVPRRVAVDAGNVVRCGLFGASTYRKPLPDNVLKDYMQFCEGHWDPNMMEGRKALVPAQRVVAAVPDFSWGWAAVAGGYWKVAGSAATPQIAAEARAKGREAADRAIALDGKNSEAFFIKAMLLDRHDWIGKDSLFKRAVAARRLDCGCEYHQYGWLLVNAGRVGEGLEHLRQANDMLALYVYTPLTLAYGLVAAGELEEARTYFDATIELAPDSGFADSFAVSRAAETGDLKALADPTLEISGELREALLKGFGAAASQAAGARAEAVRALLALPEDQQGAPVAKLLATLGAHREALLIASRLATGYFPGPSIFWDPRMRPTLDDPGFSRLAKELGLMKYWKATRTRPDVCSEKAAPPFCRMI